MKTSKWSR